jgi:hypothetical protein
MEPLVFRLPLPENMGNFRGNWKAKNWKRVKYEKACTALLNAKQLPRVPEKPMKLAVVSAHLITGAPNDEDNLMARCKFAIDWIVKAGYLVDDRKKCLSWVGIPTQEVKRKAMALIITLTPVPEPEPVQRELAGIAQ